MVRGGKYVLFAMGGLALLLLLSPGAASAIATALDLPTIINTAASVIADYEDFSSTPYWDVSRYSWGYGTPAPGPTGTISASDALTEMRKVVSSNYDTLRSDITRDLNINQWIAILDFAYNEGIGAAGNLVQYINAGDDNVLQSHWLSYIYAGGVVNSTLQARRGYEWSYWTMAP